jgi:hypothetical protein
MNSSVLDQLIWLKSNTLRTGAIHEAQALQLRNYPLLLPKAISGTGTASVDIDARTVDYSVEVDGLRPTKKFKQICLAIEKWTRTILWDDTLITIKANNKLVFDSRNQNV